MNKEYMYLSDKEMVVTSENGHMQKREIKYDNMPDILLIENKLEEINNLIDNLQMETLKKPKMNRTDMLFSSLMTLLALMLTVSLANNYIEMSTFEMILPWALSTTLWGYCFFHYNSKRKVRLGYISKLAKAKEYKVQIEKELSMAKTKATTDKDTKENSPIIIKYAYTLNKKPDYDEMMDELYNSFVDGYTQASFKERILSKSGNKKS